MAEKLDRELSWDDTIDANADVFTLLEPGEYEFQVIGFERARWPGSQNLPPCPQAKVKLLVGGVHIEHNLFLHSKCEGFICAFFKSIGARKSGERIQMDWNKIAGATGRCQVGIRKCTGKDGIEKESNDISKFLPADEPSAKTVPQPTRIPVQPNTVTMQPAMPVPNGPQLLINDKGEVVDDLPF